MLGLAELTQPLGGIDSLAADGGVVGICAIDGIAGIGKTTFAVHAAYQLTEKLQRLPARANH